MFNNLHKINYYDYLINKANNDIIKNDRLQYMPIINLVKAYIKKSNNMAIFVTDIKVLIYNFYENSVGKTEKKIFSQYKNIYNDTLNYELVLYSDKPKILCTQLINIIHSNFGKFTQMKSIITDQEYVIMYNMRPVIIIFKIEQYKNKNITDIIKPKLIDDINYLPINIEIIDIYHKLFLLNFYNDWGKLTIQESLVYNYFITYYKKYIKIVKEKINKESDNVCISCKINRNTNINNIKYIILELFDNENYIIINDWALYLFNKYKKLNREKKENDDNIISIVSQNKIDRDYTKIVNFLSKFTKYGIYYIENKLYIPNNRRLKLYTFYIKYPDVVSKNKISSIDKPFLEIYNNASYELLPFIKINYNYNNTVINLKIGNYHVLLYFIFIKIWVLDLLDGLDLIKKNKAYVNYMNYYNLITMLYKNKKLFNVTKYFIGINFDEKIEKKINISKSNNIKKNYYPELSMKKNKTYKLVATS